MNKTTLLFLLLTQVTFAQSSIVEETINKIEITQDTIKSVFDWVTDNVKYDVGKLNEIRSGAITGITSKFDTETEYKEYLLSKVIKQKKGVCEDYALLFDVIVRELGYDAYIVEGYTKTDKGKINRSLGHAWNAVKVGGEWKLYDLTWAAGYVEDGKRFVKKFAPRWYDVDANTMIKTHMPYDPVWQLSLTPMSFDEFEQTGEVVAKEEGYDYESKIEAYLKQERKPQMKEQVSRSEEMGEGTRLVEKWRKRMTKKIGIHGAVNQKDILDNANESMLAAVDLFNEYIKAKNKQFKGKKWGVENSKLKLEKSMEKIQSAFEIYKSIEVEDKRAVSSLNGAKRSSEKLISQINREFKFIERVGGR